MSQFEAELLDRFSQEMFVLKDNPQRIIFDVGLVEAWAILCSIQLASRHPKNSVPVSEIAKGVVLRIQAELSRFGPAIAEVAEMGWHDQYDC